MAGSQEKEHERRGWHLSREVSVSHLLATVTILVSVIVAWNKMESRIESLEREHRQLTDRVEKNDNKIDRKLDQIMLEIAKINDRMYDDKKR